MKWKQWRSTDILETVMLTVVSPRHPSFLFPGQHSFFGHFLPQDLLTSHQTSLLLSLQFCTKEKIPLSTAFQHVQYKH